MRRSPAVLLLMLLLTAGSGVRGSEILIWDNDQGSTFYSWESGLVESCHKGIEQALNRNGYYPAVVSRLPEDLDSYEVIFVVLGFFCPG